MEIETANSYGSTDVGDVQHIVPGIMIRTATYNIGAPGHSWQITACSGMSIGCLLYTSYPPFPGGDFGLYPIQEF